MALRLQLLWLMRLFLNKRLTDEIFLISDARNRRLILAPLAGGVLGPYLAYRLLFSHIYTVSTLVPVLLAKLHGNA